MFTPLGVPSEFDSSCLVMIIGPTNPEFVTALHLRENDTSSSWIWDHLDLLLVVLPKYM
ncbi:MAG TPA: hypothetical protein VIY08_06035 [Candidatus Nitrosocosmicus sp.]